MMGGPDSRPQDSRLGPGPGQDPRMGPQGQDPRMGQDPRDPRGPMGGQDPRLGPQGPRVQVQDPRLMSPQDPRARPDSHGSQDPRARPDSHGSSHSTESKGGREKSVAEHISSEIERSLMGGPGGPMGGPGGPMGGPGGPTQRGPPSSLPSSSSTSLPTLPT